MDELNAFNTVFDEMFPKSNKNEKKRRPPVSENWKYVRWTIYGLLLLLFILYLAIHPIDRLCLRFALFDNCEIRSGINTVKVDGNIMFSDGVYYEIGENASYEYRKRDGQWYRYRYYPSNGSSDDMEFILDSDNIERPFLPFMHMDINKKDAYGLTDTKIQVLLGVCKITGKDQVWNYWTGETEEKEVSITITKFGLVRLELHENYIIVK